MDGEIDLSKIELPPRKKYKPTKKDLASIIEVPGTPGENKVDTLDPAAAVTIFDPQKKHKNGESPFGPEVIPGQELTPDEEAEIALSGINNTNQIQAIDLDWFTESGELKPHRDIDLGKLLQLRKVGLSVSDLAKYFGVDNKTINKILADNKINMYTDVYSAKKEAILEATEANLVNAMNNPLKIAQASLKDCAQAFGIVYDKNRLQRGKSTDNVAVSFSQLVEGIIQKRKVG